MKMSKWIFVAAALCATVLYIIGLACIEPKREHALGVLFLLIAGVIVGVVLMATADVK